MPTVRRAHLLMVFATAFAMVGCAAMRRHEARDTGDLLVSAGFTTKPADTPERAQELHAMPPLKLVSQSKDGHVVYRYADPYSCDPRSRWLKAQAADGWPSADPRGRPPETADTPARVPRDRHTRTPIGPPNTLNTASSRAFAAYSFSAESASAPAR